MGVLHRSPVRCRSELGRRCAAADRIIAGCSRNRIVTGETTHDEIEDKLFHQEMYNICDDGAKTDNGSATCKKEADKLYDHVKRGP